MKWFFVVVTLLVIVLDLASSKSSEKGPIKKASSSKPTKHPKSILEEFTGLSDEDTAFLKELDKQFKVHGDKIKIKVEKINGTSSKNSKRTIDGSLGYGYQTQPEHGFYFSQPKFMIYPYSQHDIPPANYPQHHSIGPIGHTFGPTPTPRSHLHTDIQHHHGHLRTDVQVQKSHGFEIQEVEHPYADYQHQYQHHQPDQSSPVIVLRIPGPHKYAAHLQTLLQRYLELRAAQYISEIEHQEAAQGHIEQPHIEQHYAGPRYLPKGSTIGPTADTGPQVYPSPEPERFHVTTIQPSIPLYEDHQIVHAGPETQIQYHHQPKQEVVVDYETSSVAAPGQRFNYEVQQLKQQQQQQQIQQIQQIQHHQQQQIIYDDHPTQLETSENYPGNKHTQVRFSHLKSPRPTQQIVYQDVYPTHQHQPQHQLQPQLQQHYQQPQPVVEYEPELQIQSHTPVYQQQFEYYNPQETEFTSQVSMVSITPKHRHYNYHAHPLPQHQLQHQHQQHHHLEQHLSASTISPNIKSLKRDAPYTEEQFKKYNKIINRLRKKNLPVPNRTSNLKH